MDGRIPRTRIKLLKIIAFCMVFLFVVYTAIFKSQEEVPVPGWEKNASRDVRLYVTGNFPGTRFRCPARLLLLVVVFSAPSNADRRDAVRASWASLADNQTRVAFIIGSTPDLPKLEALIGQLIRIPSSAFDDEYSIIRSSFDDSYTNLTLKSVPMIGWASIDEESGAHEDIIRASFVDTYDNLTLKSVSMLQWATHHCPQARFLLKADDDVYVNLLALSKMVAPLAANDGGDQRALLVGSLFRLQMPNRNPFSKVYCPHYMYSGYFWPNYLTGAGYLMSRNVVPRLYYAALETPLIHLEDVYITGLCAYAAGVSRLHHAGFDGLNLRSRPNETFPDRSFITGHGFSPEEMRHAFLTLASDAAPRSFWVRATLLTFSVIVTSLTSL